MSDKSKTTWQSIDDFMSRPLTLTGWNIVLAILVLVVLDGLFGLMFK